MWSPKKKKKEKYCPVLQPLLSHAYQSATRLLWLVSPLIVHVWTIPVWTNYNGNSKKDHSLKRWGCEKAWNQNQSGCSVSSFQSGLFRALSSCLPASLYLPLSSWLQFINMDYVSTRREPGRNLAPRPFLWHASQGQLDEEEGKTGKIYGNGKKRINFFIDLFSVRHSEGPGFGFLPVFKMRHQ